MSKLKKGKKKFGSMRDKMLKRAKEREFRGGGYINVDSDSFFKLESKNKFDIVPYIVSWDEHPNVEKGDIFCLKIYYVHRDVGPEKKTIVCPYKTNGDPCPICDHIEDMVKSGEDEDDIKPLRPKEREMYNVIDKTEKSNDVRILDSSTYLFGDVLEEEIREGEDDYGAFADLEGGKTLQVRCKKESFRGNSFYKTNRVDFKNRKDYSEKILNKTFDLDKVLVVLDYDAISEIFNSSGGKSSKSKDKKGGIGPLIEDVNDEVLLDMAECLDLASSKKLKKMDEDDLRELIEEEADEDDVSKALSKNKKKKKCPYGMTFGDDCNTGDECDECEMWQECNEAQDD